jgi:alanine-glyoxylate transaminase/serine-glyoxylate transaminase/serine-pyruvate transaminase
VTSPSTAAQEAVPGPALLPDRLLLGPGPSNVEPRVLAAMSRPIVGHLDPAFLSVVDEIGVMLRRVFGTENELTFAVSGTGSAGMEAAFVNLLEPGDTAVVCVNGVFGQRMCEVAARCGADVVRVDAEWGDPVDPDVVAAALRACPHASIVAFVHAETSTGAWTDVAGVAAAARTHAPDALVVVDAVTSLGGIPVEVDAWGVDACYSGTQKCLSVPPGLAPITFGPRAVERLRRRSAPVQSWYFDAGLIAGYLDAASRTYHHTAPVSMLAGLHEGLRVVLEEGLDARFERHMAAGRHLQDALEALGWRLFARAGARLPQLTAVNLPDGMDDATQRRRLLDAGIEVGGGLGPWAGRLWRIGLMGTNARVDTVGRFLDVLAEITS